MSQYYSRSLPFSLLLLGAQALATLLEAPQLLRQVVAVAEEAAAVEAPAAEAVQAAAVRAADQRLAQARYSPICKQAADGIVGVNWPQGTQFVQRRVRE